MNLTLYLPPSKTPVLTLYGRTSGTQVGSPVTGTEGSATVYVFAITQANGDYNVALTGISNPAGPRFALRKTATAIYVAETWEALNALLPDPDIPATPPPQVTGYFRVYDEDGALLPAAGVTLQASAVDDNATGYIIPDDVRTGTSDGSGLVSFTGLFPGATYIVKRVAGTRRAFVTVPLNATSPVSLGAVNS